MERVPKVLLVVPPCFTNRELDFEIGFPVHLTFLGRIAKEAGWGVEYLDMTLLEKEGEDSFDHLTGCLRDSGLKLVGLSNHTVRTSITTTTVAEQIKKCRPDVKVVVGGVNATFMWRQILDGSPAIDYIIRGYGQPGFRRLIEDFGSPRTPNAPGLVSRSSTGMQEDHIMAVSAEDFATPQLEGLPVSRYLEWTQTYPVLTHTGCGFSCNFCTSVMPGPYQNREIYRPADEVVAEMKQALDLGFRRYFITDNIFTSRRDRCVDLCTAMRDAGIPKAATWSCMTRVEFVDQELLELLGAAGCVNVAYGVEIATARGWSDLKKGRYSEEIIRTAFRLTRTAGVGSTAYLMLGAPFQTAEDIDYTVDLIREVDPDYRVISFFQPFPGTPYWTDAKKLGLSEIAPLDEWNFYEAPICRTASLSKTDLLGAAIRLQLDRSPQRRIDIHRDSLKAWIDTSDLDCELAVRESIGLCNGSEPIVEIIKKCQAKHGPRGRVIALYWLSAAIAEGKIEVVSANVNKEEHDYAASGFRV